MRIRLEVSFSFKRELPAALGVDLPEGATVLDALHALVDRFPDVGARLFRTDGQVRRHINALVNGGNVTAKKGFETILHDGDRLTLLPPVGGG